MVPACTQVYVIVNYGINGNDFAVKQVLSISEDARKIMGKLMMKPEEALRFLYRFLKSINAPEKDTLAAVALLDKSKRYEEAMDWIVAQKTIPTSREVVEHIIEMEMPNW